MKKIISLLSTKNEFGICEVEVKFISTGIIYKYQTSEYHGRKFTEMVGKSQMVAFNKLKKNSMLIAKI